MPKTTSADHAELKPVRVGAAAIDIGSKMHMAAVDPNCTDRPNVLDRTPAYRLTALTASCCRT
jgi:hypothetical protein